MSRLVISFLSIHLFLCPFLWGESMHGSVLGPKDRPVPGLALSLLQGEHRIAVVVCNPEGQYSFDHLLPGVYTLAVESMGFLPERREVLIQPGQACHEDIALRLKPLHEEMVVTATRTAAPAGQLGNSVRVVTEEEIRAQQIHPVSELLRMTPGMNVVQTGGPGGVTSLFLRGAQSQYTKVFLDGIPLNQPGGAVDISTLSTANLERIEVVSGSQSALYGSDAMGGVVQLFTKKGGESSDHPRVGMALEAGNAHTGTLLTSLQGHWNRGFYSAEFLQGSTRNFDVNSYFRNQTLSARVGLDLSSKSTLDFMGRADRGQHGTSGPTAFGPADLDAYYRKRDFDWGMNWNQEIARNWHQRISYSQAYQNQFSDNPLSSGCFLPSFGKRQALFPYCDYPYSSLNATRRQTAQYQSDIYVSSHVVTAGLEWERESGEIETSRVHRRNRGFYLQDQFLPVPRLAITAGIRLETNQSFGNALIPRTAASYLLRKGSAAGPWGATRIRTGFGLGIKEPNFLESFSQNPYYKGNPTLKAERARSAEIGWEQLFLGDRGRWETTFFLNQFRDQIALKTTDPTTYEAAFFNFGSSRARGIENLAHYALTRNLQITGSYTYLQTQVLDSISPYQPLYRPGAPLLRRPRHSGFVRAFWQFGRWHLQTSLGRIGRRADGDFYGLGFMSISGYTKWDATVCFRWTPRWEIYTRMENLLSQRYFEVLGYPAPIFNFRLGLRFFPWY